MIKRIGPTGEPPPDPVRPGDKGGINVALTVEKGQLVLQFGAPISWLSIQPEEALGLAEAIRTVALNVIAARTEAGHA